MYKFLTHKSLEFFYKIVSKILANRLLKKVLDSIISPKQSAVITGRLISDNVIAAYKALHTMNSMLHGKEANMTVKLDTSKVCDQKLNGHFLQLVMKKMRFSDTWISLIMERITSVFCSIT